MTLHSLDPGMRSFFFLLLFSQKKYPDMTGCQVPQGTENLLEAPSEPESQEQTLADEH